MTMHRQTAMLAVASFRTRVAPVLNRSTTLLLIPLGKVDRSAGMEIVLPEMSCFDRLRILCEKKVSTLICGALSPDLLDYAQGLGLRIIHGIAGDIDEVLTAFRDGKLDQPHFRMPGCNVEHNSTGQGTKCPDDY